MRGLIIISILILATKVQAQPSPDKIQKLDSIFSNWSGKRPGGVACIVYGGQVVYKKSFGLANVAKNIQNGPTVKYDLASNAKQFTATCIALLEEQGKLSTEDNIKKYYPDMKINEEIKIRNLIDHTSGLRDASVLAVLSGKMNLKGNVRKRYATKDYYIQCFKRETDLNFTPGAELAYTNFNYVLLGDIVEKVSGQTLARFADSAIFKPLGMNNTLVRDQNVRKVYGEAMGYLITKKKIKPRGPWENQIVGDHNLLSTVDDLIKWQQNFVDNKLGKKDPALIDRLCTSTKLNNGTETRYGYGLWISSEAGVKTIAHGGDDGRMTSILSRAPDHNLSIIVLANHSRYGETEQKAKAALRVMVSDLTKEISIPRENHSSITLGPTTLDSLSGIYTGINERGLGMLTKVTHEEGKLYISKSIHHRGIELSPLSATSFRGKNDSLEPILVDFATTQGGTALTVKFRGNISTTHRYIENKDIRYSDFKGKFENNSTGAVIKIKLKPKGIVAKKGIIKIPLMPFDKDVFFAPENDALFIFGRNDQGEVVRFKANAHDFRNFIFEKSSAH